MKHAKCASCPFAVLGKPASPVLGTLPKSTPRGVVVGEFPSYDDVEDGVPFVGIAGKALNEKLEAANLKRSELFLLHAVACRPPRGCSDDDIARAAKCCRGLFLHQIKTVPAACPTLALGKFAAIAVTGRDKSPLASRGYIQPTRLPRESNS